MANILVVDDNAKFRNSLAENFVEDGHSVDTASDPDSAKQLLAKKSYNLVITDNNMPDGNEGIALTEFITKTYPGTPVIMTTCNASSEVRLAFERAGGQACFDAVREYRRFSAAVRQTFATPKEGFAR